MNTKQETENDSEFQHNPMLVVGDEVSIALWNNARSDSPRQLRSTGLITKIKRCSKCQSGVQVSVRLFNPGLFYMIFPVNVVLDSEWITLL
jgi:hypothetical protein